MGLILYIFFSQFSNFREKMLWIFFWCIEFNEKKKTPHDSNETFFYYREIEKQGEIRSLLKVPVTTRLPKLN